jgi:hypothetical protein
MCRSAFSARSSASRIFSGVEPVRRPLLQHFVVGAVRPVQSKLLEHVQYVSLRTVCTSQETVVAAAVSNRHAPESQTRGILDRRLGFNVVLTVEDARRRVLEQPLRGHVVAVAAAGRAPVKRISRNFCGSLKRNESPRHYFFRHLDSYMAGQNVKRIAFTRSARETVAARHF